MDELIWVLITLLCSISAFVLRGYISGYAGEKGKNLATKEDIQEITEKVEGVKYEFSTKLADLNANIQRQLSLFGKRNEALTQFFEDSSAAVTFLRAPMLFSHEDLDGFDRHIRQGQEYIVRADLSYRRLRLYVQEEGILTTADKAQTAFNTLHIIWFERMTECRDSFVIESAEWTNAFKTGDYSCSFGRPACVREKSMHQPMNPPNQSRAVVMVGRTGCYSI
jgi:hypothetical protein